MTKPARAEAPEPARLPSGLKHRGDGVEIFRKLGYRNAGTFEKIDMISEPGTPTLDQLKVFLTIVETGSFAAAARALNRATSVVSYAVANLEAQLGFPLFDRDSTRKPQLTPAGRSVLAEARAVSDGIAGLRAITGHPQRQSACLKGA